MLGLEVVGDTTKLRVTPAVLAFNVETPCKKWLRMVPRNRRKQGDDFSRSTVVRIVRFSNVFLDVQFVRTLPRKRHSQQLRQVFY
jgi:hypothetical protein